MSNLLFMKCKIKNQAGRRNVQVWHHIYEGVSRLAVIFFAKRTYRLYEFIRIADAKRYGHVYRNAISAFNYESFWERSGNASRYQGPHHAR